MLTAFVNDDSMVLKAWQAGSRGGTPHSKRDMHTLYGTSTGAALRHGASSCSTT